MTFGPDCVNLVKNFEGCRLQAYQDMRGIWTIGFGHAGPSVTPGMVIDQAQADAFLEMDLTTASDEVDAAIISAITLNQHQKDALTSFQFNTGALRGSTMQRLINQGNLLGASDQFGRWNKAEIEGQLVEVPGLTRRRAAERKLFLEGPDAQEAEAAGTAQAAGTETSQ